MYIHIDNFQLYKQRDMFFVQKHLGGKGKNPPKLQNCKVVKVNSDTSSNSMDAPIATGRHRRFLGIVFVVLAFQSKKRIFLIPLRLFHSISPPKKPMSFAFSLLAP